MKKTLAFELSAVTRIASLISVVTLILVSAIESTGSAASRPDWEKAIAAANAEGKVVLITQAGTAFRKMLQPFKEKFPHIEVEQTLARAHLAAARVVSEQKQGVYTWDVMVAPSSNMATLMSDAGAFQSILPFFILPDVTDSKKWHNGFEMWANDVSRKPYTFIYKADLSGGFSANRKFIPPAELKHAKELLDPKWKSKIITGELGRPAAPSLAMAAFFHFLGEDYVRKLLLDQETVIVPEARLLLDRLVRGQNPIAIGESSHRLAELQKEPRQQNLWVNFGSGRSPRA